MPWIGFILETLGAALVGPAVMALSRAIGMSAIGLTLPTLATVVAAGMVGGSVAWALARRAGAWMWSLPLLAALVGGLAANVAQGTARIGARVSVGAPLPDATFVAFDAALPTSFGPVDGIERWVETFGGPGGRRSTQDRVTTCTLRALGPLADGGLVWAAAVYAPQLVGAGPRLYRRDDALERFASCADAVKALSPGGREAYAASTGRRFFATKDPAERTAANDTGINAAWIFGVLWAFSAVVIAIRARLSA
jgi:hypothetical protein